MGLQLRRGEQRPNTDQADLVVDGAAGGGALRRQGGRGCDADLSPCGFMSDRGGRDGWYSEGEERLECSADAQDEREHGERRDAHGRKKERAKRCRQRTRSRIRS